MNEAPGGSVSLPRREHCDMNTKCGGRGMGAQGRGKGGGMLVVPFRG